ncbi:netrin-1 isoform X1 [Cyprinodon tularosa]|uniref:netrin-1 isoform X1 n=1 Tax=Cyprinodon tularosa TaxID=77115 RepID=UPI0018E1E960|nr:netrin-1 isoform X1 [Cyprinodon tularosa]
MMIRPRSLPHSISLIPVLLRLLLLPPSLISSSFSNAPLSWTSPHEPCYHPDGRPRHCLSEFINAAYGVPVNVTHSIHGPDNNPNITTLTDLHNPHNMTCWKARTGAESGDLVFTLPLGRRFEVTYISLQFCSQGEPSDPISISILKSMDYGRTWRPMQHYSSNCIEDFKLPSQTISQTRHQETEPLCSDPRPLQRQRGGTVLAFSTLDGRPSSPDFDYSPTLQDWVTATDIRVIFHRTSNNVKVVKYMKEAQWYDGVHDAKQTGNLKWRSDIKIESGDQVDKLRHNTLGFLDRDRKNSEISRMNKEEKGDRQRRKDHRKGSGHVQDGHNVTSKEGEETFGTDLPASPKKGGKARKQTRNRENNFWASCPSGDCIWTVEGRSKSSSGRELRKRRNNNQNNRQNFRIPSPSGLVVPVQALAISDLQVGGRCKCNGHASRCRRNDRGRTVCVCEHHTAGPDCDVCEDFYVDRPWHRATPTHPNPCVACQCHPLGAVGHWCNQTSGQCLCREGVTGLRCNRCAPGYKQGKSPLRPCIRIQEVAPTPVYQTQHSIAEECVSYCKPSELKVKMNLETYCLKDYVLKVQVRGMERSGPWWQFSISIQTVFRTGSNSRVRRGLQSLWVPDRDLSCGCPALHVGRTFLLIGAEEGERSWAPGESRLVADRSTLALQWREHWSPKLRGFRGQDKRGRCPQKSPNSQHPRSGEHTKTHSAYIPPHLLSGTEANPHGDKKHSVNWDDPQTGTNRDLTPTEVAASSSTLTPVCSTQSPE